MIRQLNCFLLLLIFFTLYSCEKEVPSEDLQIHFEADFPLKDLNFDNDHWIVVGGEVFENGLVVTGILDSIESEEKVSNTCLNSITKLEEPINEAEWITTGVYTYGAFANDAWSINQLSELFILKEIIASEDHLYAVGGAGLSTGVFYKIDSELNIINTKRYDHDLYFIRNIADKTYVGGVGLLMHTMDLSSDEVNWVVDDAYDDHWLDIDYDEDLGIVILGASGRIIRSRNDGQSWDELRAPVFSGISNFKDMLIYEGKIYIACGENICASDLQMVDWNEISIDGLGEINRMIGNNGRIYFVSSNGYLASLIH